MNERCEHFDGLSQIAPQTNACEECRALGATWYELRVCLTCGNVGCCEDSPHTHALKHFNTTGHPMIAPLERSETWSWCYVHRRYFELEPELRPKRRSALAALLGRLMGK
jgi:uncharacterized UBP type Zn finger protein